MSELSLDSTQLQIIYWVQSRMGNKQSLEAPVSHPRFSKVQYFKNSLNMLVREPLLSMHSTYEPWKERQRLYSHVYNHADILRPSECEVEVASTCSDSCTLVIKFDDKYPTTLKAEIASRQETSTHFTEEELWHFLLVVSRVASQVYSYGEKHMLGNIHPYNILLNRKGDFKILATNFSFSLPAQLQHFQEYRLHGDSRAFVSPQLLGFLTSSKYADYPNYPPCVDRQAAEAYCLGMTLLSMATLETSLMRCFSVDNHITQRQKKSQRTLEIQPPAQREAPQRGSSPSKDGPVSAQREVLRTKGENEEARARKQERYSQVINTDYFDELLKLARRRYSNTFFEMLLAFLHSDPDTRIKPDRLYRDYLSSVEKEIETFDRSWLDLTQLHHPPGPSSLD